MELGKISIRSANKFSACLGFSFYLNSTGQTAHSSVPQLGRNAIVQLISAYNEVVSQKFSAESFWVNTTISLDKVKRLFYVFVVLERV